VQVAAVCDQLMGLPQLRDGYMGVGFSQGGQFLRAVAQRCQHLGPPMHTLVTLGAQVRRMTWPVARHGARQQPRIFPLKQAWAVTRIHHPCLQHQGVMDLPGCWQPGAAANSTPSLYCRVMQARACSSACMHLDARPCLFVCH
jgi:palmitoyl-protein thioesterase